MRRTHPGTSVCNCYHISRPFRAILRNSAVFPEFFNSSFNFHKFLIVVADVSNKDVFKYDRNPISHALVKSNIRFVDNDDERNHSEVIKTKACCCIAWQGSMWIIMSKWHISWTWYSIACNAMVWYGIMLYGMV